jgi:hypothetical protein
MSFGEYFCGVGLGRDLDGKCEMSSQEADVGVLRQPPRKITKNPLQEQKQSIYFSNIDMRV